MRNRIVGGMVIGIALLIGFIIFSFNRALGDIVNESCTHGPTCPMWGTIDFQTNIALAVMTLVIALGIYLMFFSKEEKVVTHVKVVQSKVEPKKISKESYGKILSGLDADEKKVFEKVIEAEGAIFQSELVDKTGLTKVRVTRILDRLEGKKLIERRRRGMTNVVILK